MGTRGYPSYYGGFETAVRYLVPHLVKSGWQVDVYGRQRPTTSHFEGAVISRYTLGFESRSMSTLSFGFTAAADVAWRKPDVALVMNVANGYWLPFLRARRVPTVVNVDGIEWERAKWGRVAKMVFRGGGRATARWADELVFDARAISEYWRQEFDRDGTFIPYGGRPVSVSADAPMGLVSGSYLLYVARFVPENTISEFLDAIELLPRDLPVVIVGASGYGGEIDERVGSLASTRDAVRWLGHVKDDALLDQLWAHAGVYFHGHSVGGTNPALVQAMWAGAPILARDTVFNREVLDTTARFVEPEPMAIADAVLHMLRDEGGRRSLAEASKRRAAEHYTWEAVTDAYERLIRRSCTS